MTLDEFLDATDGIPEPALRSAMVAALAVEPARTPDAYPRFYERVLERLEEDAEVPQKAGYGAALAHRNL